LNLFEKHNFSLVGRKKEWLFIDGKWIDENILQLVST